MIGQLLAERYLILERLGSGGFSETYLARDKYLPCHPLCVVKCFNPSPNSTISLETAQKLFETEAQVLDLLGQQHEQIPTLLAYCYEQEWIYQIQEYVEGDTLEGWVTQGCYLTSEAAIDILWQLLPVLDYIHSQGVIHRDIKPSHLIRRRSDGVVVLIDFGAAYCLSESEASNMSNAMVSIGTLGYMPEEQQAGMADFSSDLYALGVSLIQLLIGIHPRELKWNPISGELDWQAHLQGQEIDSALVQILNRMVQQNPQHRYHKASEVMKVLQSPAPIKRTFTPRKPASRRWLGRVWKPVALSLLLLGGGYFSSRAEEARAMLAQLEQVVSPDEGNVTLVSNIAFESNVNQMLFAPDNRFLVTAESNHALHLWAMPTGTMLQSLSGHTDTITALDVSRDSRLLASGGKDRTLRLWDTASGALLWNVEAHSQTVTAVAISPDGRAIASGSQDGTLKIWNSQTGELIRTLTVPEGGATTALTYGDTAEMLISANDSQQIQVWDINTGQLSRIFAGHKADIMSLRMADDHTLFSFGKDRTLVWDLNQENLVQTFPENSTQLVATLLGKHHAVTVYDDGNIRVWNPQGQLIKTLPSKCGQNLAVALGADHRYLAGFSRDKRLRIWEVSSQAIP